MTTHGLLQYFPPGNPLSETRGVWGLRASAPVTMRLKRMFPRAAPMRDGTLALFDTAEVARDIEWALHRFPLDVSVPDLRRLRRGARAHRASEETVAEILSGSRAHLEFRDPARPARDYQLVAADLILTTGRLLLTDELGFAYSISRSEAPSAYRRRSAMLRYIIPKHRSWTRPGRGWATIEPYLDKDLSPLIDSIDARQLAILLEAVHMGDGAKQRGQTWTQRSYHIGKGNRLFAERLQSLCVRRGWRASLVTTRTASGAAYYRLHLKADPVRSIGGHGKAKLERVDLVAGERVWCVENDVGTLIIRRNGKVAIVGNCIGRLERDGQDDPVLAYFLVAESGADPVIAEVLGLKRMQSDPIQAPDGAPFEQAEAADHRLHRLAVDVLRRHGRNIESEQTADREAAA